MLGRRDVFRVGKRCAHHNTLSSKKANPFWYFESMVWKLTWNGNGSVPWAHVFVIGRIAATPKLRPKNNSYVNGVTMNSCCVWVGIHNLNVRVRVWIFILFVFHSFGAVFCLFNSIQQGLGGTADINLPEIKRITPPKIEPPESENHPQRIVGLCLYFAFQLLVFRNIPDTAPWLSVDTINGHHQQQTGFIFFQIPTEKNRNSNCYFPYESGATHQKQSNFWRNNGA